jgi:hypothetical protein
MRAVLSLDDRQTVAGWVSCASGAVTSAGRHLVGLDWPGPQSPDDVSEAERVALALRDILERLRALQATLGVTPAASAPRIPAGAAAGGPDRKRLSAGDRDDD